jgi:hemerythrin-like metal-binding protein
MAPIEWRPEYSVGDPAVDHEHRELIELVNDAAKAILERHADTEIDTAFGDLYRAISAHFAHEEEQMRRARYGEYPEHKADHERLLDDIRDIMDKAVEDADRAADRLTAVLEAWFTGHFRTHDTRLHRRLGPHAH